MRQTGCVRGRVETIVAAGPNASRPHARPGWRPIAEGDLVIVDFEPSSTATGPT